MKQSQLFTRTRKEAPKDEISKNAQLLIRAGYIHKEMAGVYSFLPLGRRVLENIVQVIREEMNAIGGQEISLTALQDKMLWEKTDRWADEKMDVWFKTALKNGSELGLGVTHEEPLTAIMSEYISSYRDLPVYAYQFQTKFRNETRAKSGIMRGREFLMKDLYSFSKDEKEHALFYAKVREAYITIFKRLGIGEKTHLAFAAGGTFSKYSEEFQTESEAGEDTIYVDTKNGKTINKEVLTDEVLADLGIDRANLVEKKSIEVGNIFNLGTKFSEPLNLTYLNEKGEKTAVVMGSYGLGPSRVMGTIVELLSDEKGIVWPKGIAPFQVHLTPLFEKTEKDGEVKAGKVAQAADELYAELTAKGISILYDDRNIRPGEKFADSDLIGIPLRVVISEKTIAENIIEVKERSTGTVTKVKKDELVHLVQK
jgi:prolyl-tRNA synthetase